VTSILILPAFVHLRAFGIGMRITVFHNTKAGSGGFAREDLIDPLLSAGHAAAYKSTRDRDFERALANPGDVALVAGGDGTVRSVARHLIGRGIPIALVSLGTANNIAKALGLSESAETAISNLATATRIRFDVGIARGAWGETHFLEGVGLGLFSVTMCLAQSRKGNRRKRDDHHDLGLTRDLRYLSAVLARMKPQGWQIEADGRDLSGEYYLCEAMNIASIGPNLRLAPGADPTDGLLDLVLAAEGDRPRLRQYLAARIAGHDAELHLPTHRVKRLTMTAAGAHVHVDDLLESPHEKPSAVGGHVELTLVEGGLEFLAI
jgi:diacylglycerol kinase (ATP)